MIQRLYRLPALRWLLAWFQQSYVRLRVRHVSGLRALPLLRNQLVVVCLVRDGGEYIPAFLAHYFALGVQHIVFLDNGSHDQTIPLLYAHPRVTVLRSSLPFKHYQHDLRRYLLRRFGRGRWCLYVDIDEFFDYPCSDRLCLPDFLAYLDSRAYTALVAQMVDMFSEEPLGSPEPVLGTMIQSHYRYYDPSDLEHHSYARHYGRSNTVANPAIDILVGGIRKSVFGVNVWLTKHPLMFGDGQIDPMLETSHTMDNARIADISAALLHYKFFGDFAAIVERGVREQGYYRNSEQYKQYKATLDHNSQLQLKLATARELQSVDDLVEQNILVVSDGYTEWVRRYGRAQRP